MLTFHQSVPFCPKIVLAGQMYVLKSGRVPPVSGSTWYRLGYIPNYESTTLMYAGNRFSNQSPSVILIAGYHYDSSQGVEAKLLVGRAGENHTINMKYKIVNGNIYFWATSSAQSQNNLYVLSGAFIEEFVKEKAPDDAISFTW